MKTALAIRHLHFEDLGTLEPLLRQRGFEVRYLESPTAELAKEDADAADLVVVLGGPIGAFDEATYPFLRHELKFIEKRLAGEKPLLGLCLGAQLMARLLGAAVTPMGHKEIGFGRLTLTEAGKDSVLAPLDKIPVLHWHGDHFALPASAKLLASTGACAEQAFAVGDHLLGLQFHLEASPEHIESWLVGHCCELNQANIDPQKIREDARRYGPLLQKAAHHCIGGWLDRLEAHR